MKMHQSTFAAFFTKNVVGFRNGEEAQYGELHGVHPVPDSGRLRLFRRQGDGVAGGVSPEASGTTHTRALA